MDGILNINKPAGRTSFSVVAQTKRLSGERRVGHAGTLDPAATGVLPVCLGRGTRIVEFLHNAVKTYQAEIELGITTDTYDLEGEVIHRENPDGVSRQQLETALDSFRGTIQQTPPMYSAVKHQGTPLYALARAGISVIRKPRSAEIYRLVITDWQPPVISIEIDCGKGTYIRSLAHDLGQLLGCGACLKSLIRTRYGIFKIEDAISLPQLEDAFHHGHGQRFLHPVDSVLQHWPSVVVSGAEEAVIRNGGSIELADDAQESSGDTSGEYRRAYAQDGSFLGILRHNQDTSYWHAAKVFV